MWSHARHGAMEMPSIGVGEWLIFGSSRAPRSGTFNAHGGFFRTGPSLFPGSQAG
jgi:hypothetical protein